MPEEKKQLECKGRNGYFKFGSFYVYTLGGTKAIPEKQSYVDIESTRPGKSAPIVFTGTNDQLIELFEGILAKLKETAGSVTDKPDTKVYETEALYRYEKDESNGNPLGLKFEVHKAGENGLFNEIAVDCFNPKGECVGSAYIGLDIDKKDMRVLLTADSDGHNDQKIAIYPMRPLSEAIDANYN